MTYRPLCCFQRFKIVVHPCLKSRHLKRSKLNSGRKRTRAVWISATTGSRLSINTTCRRMQRAISTPTLERLARPSQRTTSRPLSWTKSAKAFRWQAAISTRSNRPEISVHLNWMPRIHRRVIATPTSGSLQKQLVGLSFRLYMPQVVGKSPCSWIMLASTNEVSLKSGALIKVTTHHQSLIKP